MIANAPEQACAPRIELPPRASPAFWFVLLALLFLIVALIVGVGAGVGFPTPAAPVDAGADAP